MLPTWEQWPSGLGRRPDVRWFESHFGKNFSLRNFGNSVYPACQCLSDETVKAVGPFYLVQALTLGLWVQWPGGPVDLKTYWPPKKLTGPGGQ